VGCAKECAFVGGEGVHSEDTLALGAPKTVLMIHLPPSLNLLHDIDPLLAQGTLLVGTHVIIVIVVMTVTII